MTRLFQLLKSMTPRLSKLKLKAVLPVIALAGLFGFMVQMLPQKVQFSFAGSTCQPRLEIFPKHLKVDDEHFKVESNEGLFASKICFQPRLAPGEDKTYSIKAAPLGIDFLATRYTLAVGESPRLSTMQPKTKIAITKPAVFTLSSPDRVHNYEIRLAEKKKVCNLIDRKLSCGVKELGLAQGATHEIELWRTYGNKPVSKVAATEVEILPAVQVTSSSVSNGQTLYNKAKEFTVDTDKQLKRAEAVLVKKDDSKEQAIKTSVEGNKVVIRADEDLAREASYTLTLKQAEALDGSTLPEPYKLEFSTSGPPKVVAVNPAGAVDPGATITVSFDQAIAEPSEAAKSLKVQGVEATVSVRGSEASFKLVGGDRCAEISLLIPKGIKGADNDLPMKEDWSHKTRINCRSTSVIGYSVKGRPITAYTYGSGSTTILFTGGIHGSEPSGVYILNDWIAHLDANAHKIPAGRKVVVVPSLNPDGIAAGARNNASNVNLDRNFATSNWTKDITSAGGFVKGGGGSAPNSEPETKAVANLTSQLRPRLEVSYHAYGSLVGASACSASVAPARAYASSVGYGTMIGSAEATMGYEFTGEYEEWMCEKLGVPSILIELPGNHGRYFNSHSSTMWKMVNW